MNDRAILLAALMLAIVLVSAITGCTSGASGTLNLAKELSEDDVSIVSLESSLSYRCNFYSVGHRDIKSNPSKIIIPPGRNMVDVDCWSTFSYLTSYSGGTLIFNALAGHEYIVFPEDRCLKIRDVETEHILDTFCN